LKGILEKEESLNDKEKTLHHLAGTSNINTDASPPATVVQNSDNLHQQIVTDANNWWSYVWHELKSENRRNMKIRDESKDKLDDNNNDVNDNDDIVNEDIESNRKSNEVEVTSIEKLDKLRNIIRSQAIEITTLRQVRFIYLYFVVCIFDCCSISAVASTP
jgi:hypothetical protein